jgi:hypothetical protein
MLGSLNPSSWFFILLGLLLCCYLKLNQHTMARTTQAPYVQAVFYK